MAEETKYTANIGMTTIATADGTRTGAGNIVIQAALNGTLIKNIIIKAQANTTQGAVRLFLHNNTTFALFAEIPIPAVTKSSRNPSFEICLNVDFFLKSGWTIRATTQNAESFNVFALGLNISYSTVLLRLSDTTQYEAQNGVGKLSVANPNLNGTGTIVSLIQASTVGSGWLGEKIAKIHLKATGSTTPGMLRLYIQDAGSTTKLFSEIPVPASTPTAISTSFERVITYQNFYLQTGFKIMGSTQNAESFVAVIEGMLFKYL